MPAIDVNDDKTMNTNCYTRHNATVASIHNRGNRLLLSLTLGLGWPNSRIDDRGSSLHRLNGFMSVQPTRLHVSVKVINRYTPTVLAQHIATNEQTDRTECKQQN